jgi:hypothetical protein
MFVSKIGQDFRSFTTTVYQVRHRLFDDFLTHELQHPRVPVAFAS